MSIKRVFLDWSKPSLPAVVEHLMPRSRGAGLTDLSHLVLVFYGSRAGRRCLELLTERAGGKLCPPTIVTVGQLPELLYEPQRPFATTLIQQLVWAQVLRETPPERLRLLISIPPAPDDQSGWLRLGDLLRQQHEELAGDQLDFSHVWKKGELLAGFQEVERWKLLAEIQQSYWRRLDQLELWDRQTARLVAIEQHECRGDFEIVTVGTVDLNRTVRSMLSQVAGQVTALIPASSDLADCFDEFGCLIPERWNNRHLDLAEAQIQMADDPGDQCSAVLSILSGLNGRYALDDITIGMPDPQLVLPLRRRLDEYGVPSSWPVDCDFSQTGPYRLLEAVVDFLEESRADNFSALIRHPDFSLWLDHQSLPVNWLNHWDRYFSSHLPRHLEEILEDPSASVVQRLYSTTKKLLAPFARGKDDFTKWGGKVDHFLLEIYGKRVVDPEDSAAHRTLKACQALQAAFAEQGHIPKELECDVTAAEAIRLILRNVTGELSRRESEPGLQLAGWLELPLDDAPVSIVTTFNETYIPTSINHDLFLPNRLRTHLNIEDNHRRYARDLYLLSVLIHSREVLRLIVARRDTKHDPLIPSRLLFATDAEQIARRVLAFYDPQQQTPRRLPSSPLTIAAESTFPIPRPAPLEQPHALLRVTEFRDYLASPYRYYLRHILGLNSVTDDLNELDGAAFGTLVHDVLKLFAQGSRAGSSDAEVIADDLNQRLQEVVESRYGQQPLAAILIQAEQARRRLRAFAHWQANWRREGWEIHSVELANEEPVPFPLRDGRTVHLKGRIDRIDVHRESSRWAIFDYKTGDAGAAPEKTHRWRDAWVDLQLPLYRYLAEPICGFDDVQLGYIVLPRDADAVTASFADWSFEDLASADETARLVARKILDEEFWVPLTEPAGTLSDFDVICQSGVFGQEVLL